MRSIALSEGVTLVDVYAAFGGDTMTLIDFDGLHPTPAGYERIAQTFLTAIRQNLEQPPTLTLNPLTGGFATRGR